MAYLIGANLSGAILTGTILRNACLDGANFERATVSHTIFASVDLSSCTGLDSIDHVAPSTLGVDSIIHSNGRIPEIFLRGVGLPDEWIDYIPSLDVEHEIVAQVPVLHFHKGERARPHQGQRCRPASSFGGDFALFWS